MRILSFYFCAVCMRIVELKNHLGWKEPLKTVYIQSNLPAIIRSGCPVLHPTWP